MSNVGHDVSEASSFNAESEFQLINRMFEAAQHPGISQFRVGTVPTTVLDTAIVVTFSTPLPDADYEVFLQPNSNVSTTVYPTSMTASGFTLNLSVGVNAVFSYLAIGTI